VTAQPSVIAPPRPRRRWIWITVALVTALVVVTPVGFRLWLKASHRNLPVPTATYRQRVSGLQVVAPAGVVILRPGDTAGVTVAGSLSWVFGRPSLASAVRRGALVVSARCPSLNQFDDCSVGLTISVPARLPVTVSAGSGSISVLTVAPGIAAASAAGLLTATIGSGHLAVAYPR